MKTHAFILCGAAVLLGLSACNKNEEQTMTRTSYADIYSLVVPETGAPVVSATKYVFLQDMAGNKIRVSTDALNLGGSTVSFNTVDMPVYMAFVKVGGEDKMLMLFRGENVGAGSDKIEDFYCEATYASPCNDAKLLDALKVQLSKNPLSRPSAGTTSQYIYMDYEFNGYDVYTFWPDMLYSGTLGVESATSPAVSSSDMTLRVKLNIAEGKGITADIFFYNLKLSDAEDAVAQNLMLKDQAVNWTSDGFSIDVKDAKALNVEDGKENIDYEFKQLSLESNDDMKGAAFTFQLNGGLTGRYAGRCIFSPK